MSAAFKTFLAQKYPLLETRNDEERGTIRLLSAEAARPLQAQLKEAFDAGGDHKLRMVGRFLQHGPGCAKVTVRSRWPYTVGNAACTCGLDQAAAL